MPYSGQIKFIDTGSSKLRYQYAAIAGAVGAILLLVSFKTETKQYLTSAQTARRSEKGLVRLWLDSSGSPVGAAERGQELAISFWSGEIWRIDLGAPAQGVKWAVAADSSEVAWIAGSTLYLEPREAGAKVIMTPLPAEKKAWALSWLSDKSVAVVFDDASVGQWDSSGRTMGEKHLSFSNPEQAAAGQDYVSLASARSGNIITYRYRPGAEWEVVERSPAPNFAFQLVMPAPGVAAGLSEAGLNHGGDALNTPGAVRSAAAHLDTFLVTGADFDKVLVLDPDGERYTLAEAQPGSLVAAAENQFAVSGPDGTRLFNLGSESRLTPRGRSVVEVAFMLIGAAMLLCFGPFLIGKLMGLFSVLLKSRKRKGGSAGVPRQFEPPPPELITAFQNGEGVVWAGAGLSAQSGLPLRAAFVTAMIRTVSVEGSVQRPLMKRIESLAAKGDLEQALDLLVSSAEIPRADLIAHYRAVYYKFVARSKSHESLSRMPLSGVITTNYDGLLDASSDPWSGLVLTLASFASPEMDSPFLVKLYGDLPSPPTALLSRFEFAASFPPSGVASLVRGAIGKRTLLFVGCSLEGMLSDLAIVGAPKEPRRTHFAAVGVSGSKWREQAGLLEKQYGIRVLPCSEEAIAMALPQFLESLSAEIEKQSGAKMRSVPAMVAETSRV